MIFNTHVSIESDTVGIYAHAADVLQALVSVASSSNIVTDSILMRLFITRRCFKKIAMRFRSRPFEKPILEILGEWKYNDAIDNLGKLDGVYHIVSPRLHGYFDSAGVPFQDTTDQYGRQGRGYLLSKDEAIGWVDVLGSILLTFSSGMEGFKRDRNEKSLRSLVDAQKDLVTYLYKTPEVLTIFALPSFTSLFRVHWHSPRPVPWMDKTVDST
jgi:hypothetical protein